MLAGNLLARRTDGREISCKPNEMAAIIEGAGGGKRQARKIN